MGSRSAFATPGPSAQSVLPVNAPDAYDRSNEQQFRTMVTTALGRPPEADAGATLPARMAASETLADGAFCNIWNNTGVCELRNADNTDPTKSADVFRVEGRERRRRAADLWSGRDQYRRERADAGGGILAGDDGPAECDGADAQR